MEVAANRIYVRTYIIYFIFIGLVTVQIKSLSKILLIIRFKFSSFGDEGLHIPRATSLLTIGAKLEMAACPRAQ